MPEGTSTKLDAVRRIKPEDLRDAFTKGEAKLVKPEKEKDGKVTALEAVGFMQDDGIGPDELRIIEDIFTAHGRPIIFEIPNVPFPYTMHDLEVAKATGEMLIARPAAINVKVGGSFERRPITLRLLTELFRDDPRNSGIKFFDDSVVSFIDALQFGREILPSGWKLVCKDLLFASKGISWDEQNVLLEHYSKDHLPALGAQANDVSRRSAIEGVFDRLMHYTLTGNFLVNGTELTTSHTDKGNPVGIQDFRRTTGMGIAGYTPNHSESFPADAGIVVQR